MGNFTQLLSLRSLKTLSTGGILLASTSFARDALALQPLSEFLTSAKTQSFDQREAKATVEQRDADATQATARLFPTLSARAAYTRNQYEATATLPTGPTTTETITITPQDQLDATFTASIPIIDVGSWMRISAANVNAEGAKVRVAATANDTEKSVTRQYYQVLGTEAAVLAAQKAQSVAEESRQIVLKRKEAGSASDLEVERARAQVERSKQVLASAEQARSTARRQLATLTGLAPSEGADALPEEKLEVAPAKPNEDAALAQPDVRAARADVKAAEKSATAAWCAFAPSVTGSATERLSNATGFGGRVGTWALVLSAQVTIDPSAYYAAKSQEAAKSVALVRLERTTQRAKDAIFSGGEEVKAQVSKVKAAVAELDANQKAAKLARERYLSGAATQLDVQQADRDVLNSELAKIQAQADLAYARAALKVDSGEGTLGKEGSR